MAKILDEDKIPVVARAAAAGTRGVERVPVQHVSNILAYGGFMLRTVLALLLTGTVSACGGDSTGPGGSTAPEVLQIGGTWTYSDNISSSSAGVSCTSSGSVTVSQSGANFTGNGTATSGVCTDSFGNTYDNTGTFTVTGGQISGNQVSFQAPDCQFTGTISGTPPNQMNGSESCTVAVSGTNYTFTGPWQASR